MLGDRYVNTVTLQQRCFRRGEWRTVSDDGIVIQRQALFWLLMRRTRTHVGYAKKGDLLRPVDRNARPPWAVTGACAAVMSLTKVVWASSGAPNQAYEGSSEDARSPRWPTRRGQKSLRQGCVASNHVNGFSQVFMRPSAPPKPPSRTIPGGSGGLRASGEGAIISTFLGNVLTAMLAIVGPRRYHLKSEFGDTQPA